MTACEVHTCEHCSESKSYMLTTLCTGFSADSKQIKYMHRLVFMHNVPCVLRIIPDLMVLKLAVQAELLLCQSLKSDQNTI